MTIKGRIAARLHALAGRYGQSRLHGSLTAAAVRLRPSDAFPPDWCDLWSLYRLVRQRRPLTIVELGSGCSTVVIAEALQANGAGVLYTYDSLPEWLAATESSMPDVLRPYVRFGRAPVTVQARDDRSVWRHHGEFPAGIDFLYLDSPLLTPEVRVADDPLALLPHLSPAAIIVVDGRRENADWLSRQLRDWRRTRQHILGTSRFVRRREG